MITALAIATALAAGYQLGAHDTYQRTMDAVDDWAVRQCRRGPRARVWAMQPVFLLLIVVGFCIHPIRWTSNVRANRAYLREPRGPALEVVSISDVNILGKEQQ